MAYRPPKSEKSGQTRALLVCLRERSRNMTFKKYATVFYETKITKTNPKYPETHIPKMGHQNLKNRGKRALVKAKAVFQAGGGATNKQLIRPLRPRLPRFFRFWWPVGHQNMKNRGKRAPCRARLPRFLTFLWPVGHKKGKNRGKRALVKAKGQGSLVFELLTNATQNQCVGGFRQKGDSQV